MTEASVTYVLRKLGDALLNKAQELHDVHDEMEQMQLELGFIKAYLRDADSKQHKGNELVKEWMNRVRDMAYKIEDVIDTFLVEIEENCPKRKSLMSRMFPVVKHPILMNKLSGEIKEITQNLNKIYQRSSNLGIKNLGADTSEEPFRPTKPCEVDDTEVVGLEADKHQIMMQLLDTSISRRTVLSIVGTGGLGKTTLAQKVYKSEELKGQFHCYTWHSISQKFNLNDLLREILYSIKPYLKNESPPVADEDLPEKIKSSLENKRYLIVLDDVWTIDLWERLKISLLDSNNASRVIITSRSLDVANAADCNTSPYKLRYLNEDESLALLYKKAFQQHMQPENYPPDLSKVAKKLTKKCGGLPLALVVLGGILARRERTYNAWSTLEETMDWHNEDGKKCSQVLAMSYEDLPYDLKPCFLYFASFPEDHKISGKHVTRMWLAEGFIPTNGAGTMEDRAEEFLQELVQRCLIQVTEKSWNGCCKYCNIHDLLRDLAIREANEENFFTVFSKLEDCNNLAARKSRRVALQFRTFIKDGVYSVNTRSLLYFSFDKYSYGNGFILRNCSGFRLLRVLTIEHVDMGKFDGKWLMDMIHMRYLGFRYCSFGQKILEMNSLYNLETIDLTGSTIGKGTKKLTNHVVIPTLRHVYGSQHLEKLCPLKWDHLTNLQTLKSVGQNEVYYWKYGGSINLRTFGVHYWMYEGSPFDVLKKIRTLFDKLRTINFLEEWETLKSVLKRTKQLVSLRIVTNSLIEYFVPFGGTRGLPCHDKIQSLYLVGQLGGPICVPNIEMFPTNLTKLRLEYSRLQENPMPIFEMLQSLRILQLRAYSYVGTELICLTRGLPKLEKLEIVHMPNLHHWYIKEGDMPILTHLKIVRCWKLQELPDLQNVPTLKELLVGSLSSMLKERMQGEDHYKIENIQSVGKYKPRRHHY